MVKSSLPKCLSHYKEALGRKWALCMRALETVDKREGLCLVQCSETETCVVALKVHDFLIINEVAPEAVP